MWLDLGFIKWSCVICGKMLHPCSWIQMRNEKHECIEHIVECMVGHNQNTCSYCYWAPVLELRYDRPASGLGYTTWLEWTHVVGISWYNHLSCCAMAGVVDMMWCLNKYLKIDVEPFVALVLYFTIFEFRGVLLRFAYILFGLIALRGYRWCKLLRVYNKMVRKYILVSLIIFKLVWYSLGYLAHYSLLFTIQCWKCTLCWPKRRTWK